MGPDNAAKELYSLVLERLKPVLADYRVVPMIAEAIEILEHMSRVGNDPQYTSPGTHLIIQQTFCRVNLRFGVASR
jgi:hypothetical protein